MGHENSLPVNTNVIVNNKLDQFLSRTPRIIGPKLVCLEVKFWEFFQNKNILKFTYT